MSKMHQRIRNAFIAFNNVKREKEINQLIN